LDLPRFPCFFKLLNHTYKTVPAGKNNPALTRITRFNRNYWQHNATLCGFRHARGENVITIDDDLQQTPEKIPKRMQVMAAKKTDM
jgi:polyisoprenyl-phosphate glycosyltransferase